MAFELGWFYLAPGASSWMWYRLAGGADRGYQTAGGNPYNPGGRLESHHQTKHRETDGSITYRFVLRNVGSVGTNGTIIGGGVV